MASCHVSDTLAIVVTHADAAAVKDTARAFAKASQDDVQSWKRENAYDLLCMLRAAVLICGP